MSTSELIDERTPLLSDQNDVSIRRADILYIHDIERDLYAHQPSITDTQPITVCVDNHTSIGSETSDLVLLLCLRRITGTYVSISSENSLTRSHRAPLIEEYAVKLWKELCDNEVDNSLENILWRRFETSEGANAYLTGD